MIETIDFDNMTFDQAINYCHVRSAIYRKSNPDKKYWKNHQIKLVDQVPKIDQMANDWKEYDPRDDDTCSLFMYND